MSTTKELTKSSLSIISSQIFSTFVSISFIVYFARVFSKEQMAIYAILSVISGITTSISEMGMATLLEKNISELEAKNKIDEVKILITSIITYRTIVIIIISVIFLVLCNNFEFNFIFENYDMKLISFVVVISFIMSFSGTIGVAQIALQRFTSRSVNDCVTLLCQRIFCVAGYIHYGIYGFYTGLLIGIIVGIILCIFTIRNHLTFRLIPFKTIFEQSKGYYALGMLKVASDQMDRPVIAIFLGAEALAGYHVAKRLYDNLHGLLMSIAVPAGIKYGEIKTKGRDVLISYYHYTLVVVGHIFIPLGFFLIVAAESSLLLYGGEKYVESSPILAAFGFSLMTFSIWVMVRQAALRLISVKYLASQYIITSIVTICCYCALLPLFGSVGIPVSMGLGYFAGIFPVAKQLVDKSFLKFPSNQLLKSCGCGLCILILLFFSSIIHPGLFHIVLISIMSTVIYFSWLYILGPAEIMSFVKNIFLKLPRLRIIFVK